MLPQGIRQEGSKFIKPLSNYNETVQCGGKRGDSVKIEQTSCVAYLIIFEMKVWGVELLNCYNSDDQCGRFNNADSLYYILPVNVILYLCVVNIVLVLYVM